MLFILENHVYVFTDKYFIETIIGYFCCTFFLFQVHYWGDLDHIFT